MRAINEIKKDVEFNKNLCSLVEVLKSIAVSHYHMLERKMKVEERFYGILRDFFAFPFLSGATHPFVTGTTAPAGIVAVTTDMGLLGGLNMKVMTAAMEECKKRPYRLVVIGDKGQGIAREYGFSCVAFGGVKDEERFAQAIALRDYLFGELMSGRMGTLSIFYAEPVSFLVQRIKQHTLVPFDIPKEPVAVNIKPDDAIIESRLSDVIEYLIFLWMGQSFYEILGYSRLAELSARYVHLEGSAQRLTEVEKKLRLLYFRVRHELIDKSMREIFSSRSMYAG